MRVTVPVQIAISVDAAGAVSNAVIVGSELQAIEKALTVEQRAALFKKWSRDRTDEGLVRMHGHSGHIRHGKYERSTEHHHVIDGQKYKRRTGNLPSKGLWSTSDESIDHDDLAKLNAGTVPPFVGK